MAKRRQTNVLDVCVEALGALLLWLFSQLVRLATSIGRADRGSQVVFTVVIGVMVCAYLDYRTQPFEPGGPAVSTDENVEALARVIRSEVGASPKEHKIHVGWATRNLARGRNQSIAEMACSPCGRQQRGRPVSSRMTARNSDRTLAREILEQPRRADPTGGASHFINPVVQDRLARSGRVPGYKGRTYKVVRRRWIRKYGWEPYYRLGPDLEMWGDKRKPSAH